MINTTSSVRGRRSAVLGLVVLIVCAASAALWRSPRLGPSDGAGLRPDDLNRVQVGDVAPDFTLRSVDGRPVTLSSYRGSQFVVLTFYRGHW